MSLDGKVGDSVWESRSRGKKKRSYVNNNENFLRLTQMIAK